MSAGQILRRTVLLIRHKCQAIHLRAERHQQTMYHPLIHGSFVMEFLKDPGNKEMQHRIFLPPDDDRQFLGNVEKLPEHIVPTPILLQKQPRLHIQIFPDTGLGVVDHNMGNLGKNDTIVAAAIRKTVRLPTIYPPRTTQTASDFYSIMKMQKFRCRNAIDPIIPQKSQYRKGSRKIIRPVCKRQMY